jgi:hypothetical protein
MKRKTTRSSRLVRVSGDAWRKADAIRRVRNRVLRGREKPFTLGEIFDLAIESYK